MYVYAYLALYVHMCKIRHLSTGPRTSANLLLYRYGASSAYRVLVRTPYHIPVSNRYGMPRTTRFGTIWQTFHMCIYTYVYVWALRGVEEEDNSFKIP